MKASRTSIAVAIAAVLPLGAAIAADNDQYGKDKSTMHDSSFKKLDTNGDGRISQTEAAADSSIVFSSADANGDGYLDDSEWKASMKGSKEPKPQSMPSDPTEPAPSTTPPDTTTPPTDTTTPPPDTETPRQ